jgi:hypothetical protein
VRSYRWSRGAGNFREAMTKEAKAMNDYADGTNGVLRAVERWENEGGRVGRIYLAPDTAAGGNATAPRAGHVETEGARVSDAPRDANSQIG